MENNTKSASNYDNIDIQINRYVLFSAIILGNVGTFLNLLIFRRPMYVCSPCSTYIIASGVNTFVLLNFALLTRLLEAGFGFHTSAESLLYCKVRSYIYYSTMTFSILCTVLASADRFLATTNLNRLKYLQRKSSARAACVIVAIVSLISYTHILQYFHIDQIHHSCCPCLTNFYINFFAWFFVGFYCLFPTTLMSVFSILTIRNIHRIRHVHPHNMCMIRRRERYLIQMTLSLVLLTLLCTLPFAAKHLYIALSTSKRTGFSEIEKLWATVLRLPFYINHAMPFYVNLVASKGFRQEFVKLIKEFRDSWSCKHEL